MHMAEPNLRDQERRVRVVRQRGQLQRPRDRRPDAPAERDHRPRHEGRPRIVRLFLAKRKRPALTPLQELRGHHE